MCMTPFRNDPLPPPPSYVARTHCLSDPVDPTTYHISSTTPPRGIIAWICHLSLSPVSPLHRPHPNSTRCIARRSYVCLIRILPSPTNDSPAPDPKSSSSSSSTSKQCCLSISHTALNCMYSSLPFITPAYIILSTTSAAASNYRTFYSISTTSPLLLPLALQLHHQLPSTRTRAIHERDIHIYIWW